MTRARDPLLAEWAERIRTTRLRLGLTQSELGRRVGVTSKTVSTWERGVAFPQAEQRRRLARLFPVIDDEGEAAA